MKRFVSIGSLSRAGSAELITNAWPPDTSSTPEGQVEIYTTRGKSVVMTGAEFLEYVLPIIQETCPGKEAALIELGLKGERRGS